MAKMRLLILALILLCQTQASPLLFFNGTQPWFSSHYNDTNRLSRRKCNRIPGSDKFACDFNLPSVQQIVEEMQYQSDGEGVRASRPAVFYTNLGYPQKVIEEAMFEWVAQWLGYRGLWPDGFYWLEGPWDYTWFFEQVRWIADYKLEFYNHYPDEYPLKWQYPPQTMYKLCWYQALAAAALHPDAYVFAPKGVAWRDESVWAETEYPALTRNPNVQNIYQVDPQPPLWKIETGQIPRPEDGQCPRWEPDEKELIWSRQRGDQPTPWGWECPVGRLDYWPVP